ncbi:MAG: GntR family transcriptional regulator [Chloroflexi bacterium]|nr:GntR family transcriptional regulator [Chloroflexota bacterium]
MTMRIAGGLTRAEIAAESIRSDILNGQHLSGERLIEIKIAQALDVSQNTVRDALRILEQEGWVVKHPRHGVFVRSFSAADVAEVCALIAAIETVALEATIRVLDRVLKAEMNSLIAAARKASYNADWKQAYEHLLRFHIRIGTAPNRPQTAHLLESLYNQVRLIEALRQARAPHSADDIVTQIDANARLLRLMEASETQTACQHLREQIAIYTRETLAALGL